MARNQNTHLNQTVLITGASSGIGYELAHLFARDGFRLVLVARREEKLTQLAATLHSSYGAASTIIVQDLSLPDATHQIMRQLEDAGITVDILVNNAGFGTYGRFQHSDVEAELKMIQVNLVALTHLTRLLLDGMVQRGHGKILNVASTAAFQPGPLMAVYYATKAYVLSFSEALADDLHDTGVTVTTFCPGPTTSGFQEAAGMEESKLLAGRIMDARTVARIGYRGLMKQQSLVIPGLKNKMLPLLVRFMPRRVVVKVVRKAQQIVRHAPRQTQD